MYEAVIVDDEPYVVENLVHAIDWSGFQLEISCATSNPRTALNYILKHPVSIVITDIAMPDLDGLQLIQQIKEAKPSIFVIVLSAYNNFEYARTALRFGAENYLLKPIDPDELSDTISPIISHIQVREQLNSTYGRAMLTFRNSFTEQWVKNIYINNEFSTKADLLGINLYVSNFTVIIFSCSDNSPHIMSEFFEFLLNYLPGQFTGNFYFESPTRLVGVLSPVVNSNIEIVNFTKKIIHDAAASGLFVFVSVGSIVTHYSEVHLSYNHAMAYIWLEYTKLPFFFYKINKKLEDACHIALETYEKTNGKNIEGVKGLYDKYPALWCTITMLSLRIQSFCKQTYELQEKYPELCKQLTKLPLTTKDNSALLQYLIRFLNYSEQLLDKIQMAMYPCVNAVIKSVQEFADKDISLKTLAAKLNVTPSYLGTVFHQQTGYYFNDYLAETRLKKAAELLEHTDMKIKDIVDSTGFSSQPYFTRSFKRYFNTSPANYRRDKNVASIKKHSNF